MGLDYEERPFTAARRGWHDKCITHCQSRPTSTCTYALTARHPICSSANKRHTGNAGGPRMRSGGQPAIFLNKPAGQELTEELSCNVLVPSCVTVFVHGRIKITGNSTEATALGRANKSPEALLRIEATQMRDQIRGQSRNCRNQ